MIVVFLNVYVTNPSNISYNLNILTSNDNDNQKNITLKSKDTFNNKVGNVTKYHLISKKIYLPLLIMK
ncbi:MAG: hypothetical protein L6V81_03495 [Clostridium sp.]|nr:MAG: hypothetical protein L6V81_03495 [Clostridium sp.]